MSGWNARQSGYQTVWTFVLALLFSVAVKAEQLPIKTYTTADGLAHNAINRIVRDSRGFLWFCTDEGLSRFDGYAFTNYTTADGLVHPVVRDLLETRSGIYWVATGRGVCRFNPKGHSPVASRLSTFAAERHNQLTTEAVRQSTDEPMFVLYEPVDPAKTGTVNVLLEDRTGAIWCGTGGGLYRLEQRDGEWRLQVVEIGLPREVENDMRVRALVEDEQGSLWIGAGSGLIRRWVDGRTERYTTAQGLPGNEVRTLLLDANGQLWVGSREGLAQIALEPRTHQPTIISVYTAKNGLLNRNTRSLFQSSTGQLWVGSTTALVEFVPQSNRDGAPFHYEVNALGLSKSFVQTLAEDRDGNLWIGTNNGVFKLARNGFTTYTEADGLGDSRVSSFFESRAGELGVMTIDSSRPLSWFEGKRFNAIRPRVPRPITYFGWGWQQLTLQDQAGEWWLPTGQGLLRYAKVNHVEQLATTPPKAIYTTKDGLVSNDVFRLYEDSRGDLWIATFALAGNGIARWERATETLHPYGEADGLPPKTPIPYAFAEDHAGNLWVGFDTGILARFRGGRFALFTTEQGLPAGAIYALYVDHVGRLWIASTTGGLIRLDEPSAEQPQFIAYTTAQGLSSNNINCINEDRYGRLYIGTGHGLDRLDPMSGRVKPFTSADGLISGEVLISFRDGKGDLWFGGTSGLSHLSPQPDPPRLPPPVLITGLRIGGEPQPISVLGETAIAALELGPDKRQVQIDFVALGFSPGEGLRYQYKLEGASEDWSQLADQRTVNYANLAPGSYRFLVQAVNGDGVMSETPATFSFTILPPLWQRWWFVTLVALAVGGLVYTLYRYRLKQRLALEQMRTRIAADLHDDIGANLTKIAILSEVAHQQLGADHQPAGDTLSSIATISRESAASMRDIIWAINPKRDRLLDLTRRMRGFASDIFTSRNIEFRFAAPDRDQELRLSPRARRDIFLIFKEAVNNAARHSECATAVIEITVENGYLMFSLCDDGRGFDTTQSSDGHGLSGMSQRAQGFGGELEIISRQGKGTTVCLKVSIKGQRKKAKGQRQKAQQESL